MDGHAELSQASERACATLVIAERREEAGAPRKPRELDSSDRPAAGWFAPGVGRLDDLALTGNLVHDRELDPLHMSHHSNAHGR